MTTNTIYKNGIVRRLERFVALAFLLLDLFDDPLREVVILGPSTGFIIYRFQSIDLSIIRSFRSIPETV